MAPSLFDLANKRILVAGHRGMVGSALVRRLACESCEVLTVGRERADLRRQTEVEALIRELRPDAVIVAAAKVGGILANDTYPGEFLYDNLMIEANLIHAAHETDVPRLLFLGSSCIYPKLAPQPIPEDALLTGSLEPTNQWYAIAKIAGIMLCDAYRKQYGRSYISAMPTNLYGPHDNFDLQNSHVLPALIRKIHQARQQNLPTVTLWGTGTPLREFLHADDLADALVYLLQRFDEPGPVNVGSGQEVSIRDLALMIAEVVGWQGEFVFDTEKPDGTPRKLMDSSRLFGTGWKPKFTLREGIADAYRWFLENEQGT